MGESEELESWEYQGGTFTAAGSWLPVGGKKVSELEQEMSKIGPYYIFENKYPLSQRFKDANYKDIVLKAYIEDADYNEELFYYLYSWGEGKSVQLWSKTKNNEDAKSIFSFANPEKLTGNICKLSYKNSYVIVDWSLVSVDTLNSLTGATYEEGVALSPLNFSNVDNTYSIEKEYQDKIDSAENDIDVLDKQVNGDDSSFSLNYDVIGQQKTPFTILKNSIIHLSGDITSVTCRTNAEESDYFTVTDGTIADRDINYIKSGTTGTLNVSIEYEGLSEKVSYIESIVDVLGYKSEEITQSETYNKSFIDSNGTIKDSGTDTTTVGVYDVSGVNFISIEMQTGNSYTTAYKFFDSNDKVLPDNNDFPTITGNGIYATNMLMTCPEGASKLKITYNNSKPHYVKSVTKKFVSSEEYNLLSEEVSVISGNMLLPKEGAGISYRVSSQYKIRPIKILGVGNSWTMNATNFLGSILTELGVKVLIDYSYAGGAPLSSYWNNLSTNGGNTAAFVHGKWREGSGWDNEDNKLYSYKDIFLSDDWDIVTHQQQSGNGGNYSSFQPYLHNIVQWEKNNCRVMPLFFMHATWAYPNGYVNDDFENYYQSGTDVMYNKILESYNQAMIDEGIVNVMPSAPMIQQVRELGISDIDTSDGGSHLSTNGQFAAGCVWAEMIIRNFLDQSVASGLSIENSTYKPSSLSDEDAVKIRTLAKEIVENVKTYFPNQE